MEQYTNDFPLGEKISDSHDGVLRWCLENYVDTEKFAMEFGVASGDSLIEIAQYMDVVGFDSFQGLPEDWRPGFEKGAFSVVDDEISAHVEEILLRAKGNNRGAHRKLEIVTGMFAETIPEVVHGSCSDVVKEHGLNKVNLVHIDCDLYSSTKTVFDEIGPHLRSGAVIVFDEWHGYSTGNPEDHEQKAFKEFVSQYPKFLWSVLGHGPQQWAIMVVKDIYGVINFGLGKLQ